MNLFINTEDRFLLFANSYLSIQTLFNLLQKLGQIFENIQLRFEYLLPIIVLIFFLRNLFQKKLLDTKNKYIKLGKIDLLLIIFLTCLGFVLRLNKLNVRPFWWDELLTVWVSAAPLKVIINTLLSVKSVASDQNPPLFYIISHLWGILFSFREGPSRMLAIIFGSITIPFIYLSARILLNRTVAIISSLHYLVSPLSIYYSMQYRNYSFFNFLISIYFYLLLHFELKPKMNQNYFYLVVVGLLLLFTHFGAIWFLASIYLAIILSFILDLIKTKFKKNNLYVIQGFFIQLNNIYLIALFVYLGFLLLPIPTKLEQYFYFWKINNGFLIYILISFGLLNYALLNKLNPKLEVAYDTHKIRLLFIGGITTGLLFFPWFYVTKIWNLLHLLGTEKMNFMKISEALGTFAAANNIYPIIGTEQSFLSLWFYIFILGLFILIEKKTNASFLILSWIYLPIVITAYQQNKHVISLLARYLYYTHTAYLFVVAFGLYYLADSTVTLILYVVNYLKLAFCIKTIKLYYVKKQYIIGLLAVLLFFIFIFPQNIKSIVYYDYSDQFEDYISITRRITQYPNLCLVEDNINMLKWTAWYYKHYQIGNNIYCQKDSPVVFVLPTTIIDNNQQLYPESEDFLHSLARKYNRRIIEKGSEIYVFNRQKNQYKPLFITNKQVLVDLSKIEAWFNIDSAFNVAWIRDPAGVTPIYKGTLGKLYLAIRNPERFLTNKIKISTKSEIFGTNSMINIKLSNNEKIFDAKLKELNSTKTIELQKTWIEPGNYWLTIDLYDDYSGALYSSKVTFSEILLEFL